MSAYRGWRAFVEVGPATTVGFEVYIDQDLCRKSADCHHQHLCIDRCSMGVFARIHGNGVYPEKSHLCCMCMLCSEFCPAHAITTRWTLRA